MNNSALVAIAFVQITLMSDGPSSAQPYPSSLSCSGSRIANSERNAGGALNNGIKRCREYYALVPADAPRSNQAPKELTSPRPFLPNGAADQPFRSSVTGP